MNKIKIFVPLIEAKKEDGEVINKLERFYNGVR